MPLCNDHLTILLPKLALTICELQLLMDILTHILCILYTLCGRVQLHIRMETRSIIYRREIMVGQASAKHGRHHAIMHSAQRGGRGKAWDSILKWRGR